MFRSPAFTVIGIIAFLAIAATITFQILELDSYGMVEPIVNKVLGK
jgi:hypothetical protein